MSRECEDVRISLGVYVLGAIDPVERSQVDAHLAGCPSCRDELAGMAGLPALLGRVGEAEIAESAGPPDDLLEPLLARAAAERRRGRFGGRRLSFVAAAAVLLVVGGLFGGLVGDRLGDDGSPVARPSASPTGERLTAYDGRTGVSAWLLVKRRPSGTGAEVHLTGVPVGSRCRLEAVDRDGRPDQMGSWRVAGHGYNAFYGSSMLPRDRVTSFRIVSADGRTLLDIPA
ncbi:anti-sigma factor family protein [Thermomonospora umbrina]|uniref:Putative zinc finger protein n=1 Tax=Thermomonospora umbrina TaxID=111806 RepID=A0A3D9SRK7_9ACTN|nr:zf-HC2 domain-containing protein [Thermomonospora umbrina]REE96593.1 putative zinc finger protein [Thermomonospora umbrina]